MKPKELTLGVMIDTLNDLREKKRALNEQIKIIEAQYDELEEQIKVRLEAEGMDKGTGKKASVSISPVVVATVKDWDALCKWVKKTGHFQLFQRRISDPAFRELLELKKQPAGLEPFEKKNLNLRSL